MKKLIKYIGLILMLFPLSVEAGKVNQDIEVIRKKVIADLMRTEVNDARIKTLMESIQENGTWPDINYVDVSRTGFQHGEHLSNMVELSRAYKKAGSKFKGNKQLKKAIYSSLNLWIQKNFICDNWWWNEIGTPNLLTGVLLIMDEDLTEEQRVKVLPISGRANLNAWGARPSGDRIKIAGIQAKNALFTRNEQEFNEVIKVISGEIKLETGRGMQYDYSFHHRDDRVTSILSYGLGFADAFAEWAALVSGTKYKFPDAPMNQLIDYYLNGICQSMVYGKYPDPGAKNRGITRGGAFEPISSSTPKRLLQASSYRKDELEKLVKIRDGELKNGLTGTRFFWHSEYFSHQRSGYFTSVRMFSSRNHNMEMPYNGEGLLNHHYADGSNFISRTGKEYLDIFPVFDFKKIPGTTIVQKISFPPENEIQKEGQTEFVGAVTDGRNGAAVFDFKSLHDTLKAKKSWFFFDKEFVCLGTGIKSPTALPVATTINQCLLKGEVMVMNEDKRSVIGKGERNLANVKWILHDSIAYLFPDPIKVNLSNQSSTGTWYRINRQNDSPKEEVKKDVFKLWIDHGKKPQNATYQYIVIPGVSEPDMEKISGNNKIKILANSSDIQAVLHSGQNICQIVFHKAGEIEISKDMKVGSDSPGLVMVQAEGNEIKSITVADPSRQLSRMHLSISSKINKKGEGYSAVWDDVKQASNISFDLPQNVYAGKSVSIEL